MIKTKATCVALEQLFCFFDKFTEIIILSDSKAILFSTDLKIILPVTVKTVKILFINCII